MSKWVAEFDLEDGDTMPEYMDLNYMGAHIDFHCRPMLIPMQRVIELSENATNGDMIMAMFPNASVTEISGGATIVVSHTYKFNSTWWNAPYERGKCGCR